MGQATDPLIMLNIRRPAFVVAAASLTVLSLALVGCVPAPPKLISTVPGDAEVLISVNGTLGHHHEILVMPGSRIVEMKRSHVIVDDLTNGTPYTFQVRGLSASGGSGAWSEPTAPVVPRGRPTAPTISRVAGFVDLDTGCTARVTFSPGSDNGSPITRYEVTVSEDSPPVRGTASPIEVPGLTAHKPYDFTVTAINAAGASPASASFTGSCS